MKGQWLMIRFSHLALQWQSRGEQQAPLFALYHQQPPLLRQVSEAASAQGVTPGMTIASALALCPELQLRPWSATHEQQALQAIAGHLYQQVAQIEVQPEQGLLLEVGSMLKLYQGWDKLLDSLAATLAELGFTYHWARGTTPLMAQVLCAAGCETVHLPESALYEQLANLSLAEVALPEGAEQALQRMGLATLHDMLQLPTASLRRRFSAELLRWRSRLCGELPDPRTWFAPAPHYDRTLELFHEVTHLQALRFPVQRLLTELVSWLRSIDHRCQRLRLTLHYREQPATNVQLSLLTVAMQANEMAKLVALRLATVTLLAPVTALTLQVDSLPIERASSDDLFAGLAGQVTDAGPWLAQLQARFSEQQLSGIVELADHRPEKAWRKTPLAEPQLPEQAARVQAARPAWLLMIPEQVPRSQLQLLSGPERIACGWWDGDSIARDYFIASINERRAWVFRDPQQQWFIHGWFG